MDFNVLDYGAIGDGISNDTIAIQKAIDLASINKGRVILGSNKIYRSGILYFKSNITFYVEKGSMLKMSDKIDDFNYDDSSSIYIVKRPTYDNCDYNGMPTKFFIYGKDLENINITGDGIIDGNEEIFYGKVSENHIEGYFYPRIPLIFFENSKNVNIYNIKLQRSAFWTIHLVGCNGVKIYDMEIENNIKFANSDGIDPDHSKNVLIENCKIKSADDCIVFKTTKANVGYGSLENIVVRNCELESACAAIKFGTESASDFKHVAVRNVKINNSNRGIAIQLRDEGSIYDVSFDDITIDTKRFTDLEWWGKAEPIAITAVRRTKDTKLGSVSNFRFNNIKMNSENGIFIYGENNIRDISLNNIELCLENKTDYDKCIHDIRPAYKEGILKGPLNYLYILGASDIKITNKKFYTKNLYEYLGQESLIINSKNIKIDK